MKSGSRSLPVAAGHHVPINEKEARRGMPVVVRLKYGAELAGMRMYDDGLSFHSPAPIAVGTVVELILCGGSILVDAKIAECAAIIEGLGGFMVRARYHEASREVRDLIAREIGQQLSTVEAEFA